MRFFPVGAFAPEQRPVLTRPKPLTEDAGKSRIVQAAGQANLAIFSPQQARLPFWILPQAVLFAQQLRASRVAVLQMQAWRWQWLAMAPAPRCFRW